MSCISEANKRCYEKMRADPVCYAEYRRKCRINEARYHAKVKKRKLAALARSANSLAIMTSSDRHAILLSLYNSDVLGIGPKDEKKEKLL
jgi:hypothetical protein